jgi:hypothetical protein
MHKLTTTQQEKLIADRLRHVNFFVIDGRVPVNARLVFARRTIYTLLQSFTDNSEFKLVTWVIRHYLSNVWESFKVDLWFMWHARVLRKSPAELDELMDRD